MLPARTPGAPDPPVRPRRPKRGLGLSTKNARWNEKISALKVDWFYSWSHIVPTGIPRGVEFVPMVFGRMIDEKITEAAKGINAQRSRSLLGFNEPDAKTQGNLSVEDALALWPKLMALGLPLGSPAAAHPDKEWMKAFMQGVDERFLRVDFVTVHSYGGPNPEALVKRLESVHRMFGRPLWITEFAVGDWTAKTPEQNRHKPATVLRFMEQVLPLLDRLDFLDRYAWFPSKPTSAPLGTSALFNETSALTRLGECYRDT